MELKKRRFIEIGVVTSVFPHKDESDRENYECNVLIKDRGIELRRVPILTQYIGLAGPPHVGDVVAVAYVDGNANHPVVIGRFYSDATRPPVNKVGEIILSPEKDRLKRISMELSNKVTGITLREGIAKVRANRANYLVLDSKSGAVRVKRKQREVVMRVNVDGGAEMVLEDVDTENSVKVGGEDITISIKGSAGTVEIKLKSDGNIEISSEQAMKAKVSLGPDGVKVESDTDIKISSQGSLKISAKQLEISGTMVNINAKGTMNIESNVNTTLKGQAMVMIKGGVVHINPPGV